MSIFTKYITLFILCSLFGCATPQKSLSENKSVQSQLIIPEKVELDAASAEDTCFSFIFINEYATAVPYCKIAAEANRFHAMSLLGELYRTGTAVPVDAKQAFYWHKKAADQNFAMSQARVGEFYLSGMGIERNDNEGLYWTLKAAQQGFVSAQLTLANLYNSGQRIPKNYQQAFYWYQKAAEQGDLSAQFSLGSIYLEGKGVSKDYKKAFSYYKKVAEHGSPNAQFNLGLMYYQGVGVKKSLIEAYAWLSISIVNQVPSVIRIPNKALLLRNEIEKQMSLTELNTAQSLAEKYFKIYSKNS